MKSIYIILTKSDTILSKIVHLATADTYTHASISFEGDLQTMYSSSRKNGRTLFPAGPCTESIYSGYYKQHSQIPCAVYELQVSDEAYEKTKLEVERIMTDADKYHYNIIGLLLCQLNISYHRKHYFFCSQFVSEMLRRSQAVFFPKDTSLIKPSDYMRLPELRCCFCGCLNELAEQKRLAKW